MNEATGQAVAEQEALVKAARKAGYLGAFRFKGGVTVPAVEHACESTTTADGHGSYCRQCGETLS